MVTDDQYKYLQNKVSELEKKVDMLSMQLSRLLLKGDAATSKPPASIVPKKRDITKYRFNGEVYCKRRIVYECVNQYIKDNNINDYTELVKVFPDYIQGSLGVVKSVEIAEKYANAHKRFYFSDEDIIYFSGVPHVVCSQWEKKNIDRFLKVAKDLGYVIETISY